MEEGKNEIMELRQMIEGCFERQNKLIARLEMELEALSNFNGKQMLDSRDMRLQLKVCDRTLIRWRMSGKLPSFKISGKVYFWAFDVYKFLREEYGTAVLPEALEEQEPITINNKNIASIPSIMKMIDLSSLPPSAAKVIRPAILSPL